MFGVPIDELVVPSSFVIPTHVQEVPSTDYEVSYKVNSDRKSGNHSSISITNLTDTAMEDWTLEFDFDQKINIIWNGKSSSNKDNHYIIQNYANNQNIPAGKTVVIDLIGNKSIE